MKKQQEQRLIAKTKTADGTYVKAVASSDIYAMQNEDASITVKRIDDNTLELITPKGSYKLIKHPTINMYQAKCQGTKVQVTLKTLVGTLRSWY